MDQLDPVNMLPSDMKAELQESMLNFDDVQHWTITMTKLENLKPRLTWDQYSRLSARTVFPSTHAIN